MCVPTGHRAAGLNLSHLDHHARGLGLMLAVPGFPPKSQGVLCYLVTGEVKRESRRGPAEGCSIMSPSAVARVGQNWEGEDLGPAGFWTQL